MNKYYLAQNKSVLTHSNLRGNVMKNKMLKSNLMPLDIQVNLDPSGSQKAAIEALKGNPEAIVQVNKDNNENFLKVIKTIGAFVAFGIIAYYGGKAATDSGSNLSSETDYTI